MRFPFATLSETSEPQRPFEAAVVIPTILRPALLRAVRSVFAQDVGRVQILIGIDVDQSNDARGGRGLLDRLRAECPSHMRLDLLDLGYSTSVRHGGLHASAAGGSLRALLSFVANSRYLAPLDDDNWLAPAHLSSLRRAIAGVAWAWSRRCFTEPDCDEPVCVDDWESVGPGAGIFAGSYGGFVDPSSLMIDKGAMPAVSALWSISPRADGRASDRLVFAALNELAAAGTGLATSFCQLDPADELFPLRLEMFRARGLTLPSWRRAGIVRLAAAVGRPVSSPTRPIGSGTAIARPGRVPRRPPHPFIAFLCDRFRPAEIVCLAAGDGQAALGLAAATRARGRDCLAVALDAEPELAGRAAALGLADQIAANPTDPEGRVLDAARLGAARIAVDLVHIGPASDDAEARALCAAGWPLLRRGGVLCGRPLLQTGDAPPPLLQELVERQGALPVRAADDGVTRWVLQKP